jgi:copper transport protein
VILAIWLGVFVPSAGAHAALVNATPPENGYIPVSPTQVVLTFAEPADPRLSSIRVLDAGGKPVAGVSGTEAVPGYPAELRVTLSRTLADGVYTVVWRSVSAVDGHVVNDSFNFGVRVTPPPAPAEGAVPGTSRWISPAAAAGRWLLYAGLALFVGASTTCLLALRGRLPAGGRSLLRLALLFAGVGWGVMTLAERAAVGVPSLLPLFETREGQYLLYLGAAVALCGVAVVLVDFWPRRATFVTLGVFGVLAVLEHVLAGHADAPSSHRLLNIVAQWVHMTAVGMWVGGLVWLLLGIRGAGHADRAEAVGRYSQIAAAGLGAVVVTGLARAAVEIGSPANLFDTSYGRTLLVKVALVAVLAGLGALNRFRLVPHLRSYDEAADAFRRNARSEVVIGAVILATTAVLVGLAPAVTAVVK